MTSLNVLDNFSSMVAAKAPKLKELWLCKNMLIMRKILHFVCKSKDPKILNVTSAVYVVILSLVYFTPALTPVKPEPKHLFFDVIILVFIYSIFQLYFNLEKKPQSGQGQVFLKSLALIFFIVDISLPELYRLVPSQLLSSIISDI